MKLTKKQIDDGLTTENAFDLFMETLCPSLKTYDYFVNWERVFPLVAEFKSEIDLLNQIARQDDFDSKFLSLLEEHPDVVRAIPALAVRTDRDLVELLIAEVADELTINQRVFDFRVPADTAELRTATLEFVKATGLSRVFQSCNNLHDYLLGVEAGLDSHARKNRTGTKMEDIVELYIRKFCTENDSQYVDQATKKKVKDELGIAIEVDKEKRRFDFVIAKDSDILCIEVNYYGGSGSKLKTTAEEYMTLNNDIKSHGYKFLWITDGMGWQKEHRTLDNAFKKIDHVWTLDWLSKGYLNDLLE